MHDLSTFFEEIYCINLSQRSDRWQSCLNEFQSIGLEHVVRIEGVNGIPEGLTIKSRMGLKRNDPDLSNKLAGRIGCLCSHLKVIELAKSHNLNKILILEDDIQFVDRFSTRFAQLADQIPTNWGLIYFGGNEKDKSLQIDSNIFQVSNMLMAHCVGIHNTLFDDLIQLFSQFKWPADVCYARLQKKFPCYVFNPFLAWQKSGWSDIEQRFRVFDINSGKAYTQGLTNHQRL